jgi:hypothetical protein
MPKLPLPLPDEQPVAVNALRDRGTISPREVAYAAIEANQIPAPDSATKRDIVTRFTNVVYDLTRRGLAEKIGHGPGRAVEGGRARAGAYLRARRAYQAVCSLTGLYTSTFRPSAHSS